jgi:hypothetical protein
MRSIAPPENGNRIRSAFPARGRWGIVPFRGTTNTALKAGAKRPYIDIEAHKSLHHNVFLRSDPELPEVGVESRASPEERNTVLVQLV